MRLPPPAMVNGTCEGPAVAGASQLGRSSNRLRAQRRSLMARVQAQLCVRLIAVVSGAGACPPMPGGRSPLLHHPPVECVLVGAAREKVQSYRGLLWRHLSETISS